MEPQALGRSYGVDEEIDMGELDDELAAIDEQLSLEAEVFPPSLFFFSFLLPRLAHICLFLLVFLEQMGDSEVPAYLQDETTEPATIAPSAQPAAATGEQVDEFGLPIAPTPAAAS